MELADSIQINLGIPEGYLAMKLDEVIQLQEQQLKGRWWDMSDLMDRIGIKNRELIKEKILYPYRKQLDVDRGGFVYYPKSQGDKWRFQAVRMSDFLDSHFAEIWRSK